MIAKTIKIHEVPETTNPPGDSLLRDRISGFFSREIVIGVVGYAGSGTSFVADRFKQILEVEGFSPHKVKARDVIEKWAIQKSKTNPLSLQNALERVNVYQDLGDSLRRESGEYGAVAGQMARRVHELRAGKKTSEEQVFFLDSLKHPAEVELLRQIYGDGFRLIGVGCRPDIRERRLSNKFHLPEGDDRVRDIIGRDAEDSAQKFGQQVNKTFHLADYFVDNTVNGEDAENFTLPDTLMEVFGKFFTQKTYHPKRDEQGLYFADAAAMGSACLSRQVGAAIVDDRGNFLAMGRNDVPKPQGGLYDNSDNNKTDGRCFLRGECSNKVYQNNIIDDVLRAIEQLGLSDFKQKQDALRTALTKTRMGSLIEFSRSVHAEMDALISLSRAGIRLPPRSTLYTTTYPCHNCARHIVAAGISRVVYLEPYKKSLAIDLHEDAIADNKPPKEASKRVKFEPYVGVAPRLYQAVYRQIGERKDDLGTALNEEVGGVLRSRLSTRSFSELEKECKQFFQEENDDR